MQDSTAVLKEYLRSFYFSGNLRRLLSEPGCLPSPQGLASEPEFAEFTLERMAGNLVWIDEQDADQPPLLQETLDRYPNEFVGIRFHTPHRHGSTEETHEFSLILDTEVGLDLLVRRFFIPLILEFLRAEENSALRADLQAKWLLAVQTYNSKLKGTAEALGFKAGTMEDVLASGQVADRSFAYSILYILSELLQFIRQNQESHDRFALMVRNPLIYQSIRVLYSHTLAVREDLVKKDKHLADWKADQDAVLRHLVLLARPATLAELGALEAGPGAGPTLQDKYSSIRDLLPLSPSKDTPIPLVLSLHGQYLHRWHLARYLLAAQADESSRVQRQLVQDWSKNGVPPEESRSLPRDGVSEEFSSVLDLFCQWRLVVQDRAVFGQYFLPPDHSTETLAQIDKMVFADSGTLARRPLEKILGIDFATVANRAWAEVLRREGILRYAAYRFLALFGKRPSFVPRAPLKRANPAVSATISAPTEKRRSSPVDPVKTPARQNRPSAVAQKPVPGSTKVTAPETSQTALFQLLKNISDIDGEIEDLYLKWSPKAGSAASLFRKKVDSTIIGELTPRFTFGNLTADEAEALAQGLIEKTRNLCEVPHNKHRYLARYVFLVALRHRLKAL